MVRKSSPAAVPTDVLMATLTTAAVEIRQGYSVLLKVANLGVQFGSPSRIIVIFIVPNFGPKPDLSLVNLTGDLLGRMRVAPLADYDDSFGIVVGGELTALAWLALYVLEIEHPEHETILEPVLHKIGHQGVYVDARVIRMEETAEPLFPCLGEGVADILQEALRIACGIDDEDSPAPSS